MQTVFTIAFKKAGEKFSTKYLAKNDGGPPLQEFSNLHLQDEEVKNKSSLDFDSKQFQQGMIQTTRNT